MEKKRIVKTIYINPKEWVKIESEAKKQRRSISNFLVYNSLEGLKNE